MEIVSVIKYEGDNSTFVWKHPKEDFNTASQLIVHASQEAVFCLDGQPLDALGAGRYTLETANLPILQKLINLPTDGVSPFHCEVYFVNKTEQMAILWGTDSKIQYLEPIYGFPLSIGANGEMSLRVQESKKLLVNLVGTERDLSREKLVRYFRGFLMARIKSYIAQVIKAGAISIFEIDEHLLELSAGLHEKLKPDFADYGLSLERFFVTAIAKPEGEAQYEKFKELHFRQYADVAEAQLHQKTAVIDAQTEAQKTVISSQATAAKRAQEGYTYQQERSFDVAERAAGHAAADKNALLPPPAAGFCEACGAALSSGAVFCESCGAPVAAKSICPQCGHVLERPGRFCPKCGAKREDQQMSGGTEGME